MDTVTLTRREFEDIIDARDHAVAMRQVAAGTLETLDEAELDAYLAAPSPLAYWRKRRRLSQAALAGRCGITQPYLAQVERGRRVGDIVLFGRLARALGVAIDDIAPLEVEADPAA